jgi:hypothetical protein
MTILNFNANNSEKLILCKVAREMRGSRELDDEGASARSCARSAERRRNEGEANSREI